MASSDARAGRVQPPEAKLIQAMREARDLTVEQCGAKAGLSGDRWRIYERGWRSMGHGAYSRVRISAEALATMAEIVGGTAAIFEEVRPDAAAILRQKEFEEALRQGLVDHRDNPLGLVRLLHKMQDVLGDESYGMVLDMMDRERRRDGQNRDEAGGEVFPITLNEERSS